MTNLLTFASVAKKTTQLLSTVARLRLLLVMLLTLTASTAWGETITDKITASDLEATGTSYTAFSNVSKSSDAIYAGQSAKDNSGNIQLRSKYSNSGIVSTTSGGKVKSVKITVGSGSNTIDVYGSNTAYTAATDLYDTNRQGTNIGSVTSTETITFTEDYTYVGIRSRSGAIYLSQIDIVWETVSAAPSFTITATSNNDSYGTVSVSGTTITATPEDGYRVKSGDAGYTVTSGTADVTNNGDNTFSVTPSSNCTITINFEAIPKYTVTLVPGSGSVTDTELTETSAGAGVTLPTATIDCGDVAWTFAGWAEASVGTETTTKPTLIAAGAYSPTSDITLYAVYQRKEGGGGGGEASLTKMVAGNTLSDGDKIVVVANETSTAMYQATINSSYVNKWDCSTLTADVVADDDKNWWIVTMTDGGFYLGDDTNGYLNMSSNNLYCNESKSVWTLLDLKDGTFKLQSNERNLSYRSDLTTNPYWRMGGASYGTSGQTILNLYKYTSGGTTTTTYYYSNPDCATQTLVTLHPNGGTISEDGWETTDGEVTYTKTVETTSAVTLPTPTKDGYEFGGWYEDSEFTGSAVTAVPEGTEGEKTYHAKWNCIAPISVTVTPTNENGWRYSIGETISLEATATGGSADAYSYQWQKYIESDWEDIDGATSQVYTKENCGTGDGGTYRCVVSTGDVCSKESEGFWVRVFTLAGNFESNSEWNDEKIIWSTEDNQPTIGTVTLTLPANATYEFKVADNDGRWFGNPGIINATTDWWGFGVDDDNCTLQTKQAGEYIFTIDVEHAGDPEGTYVNVKVTFPTTQIIYFKPATSGTWADDAKFTIYSWGSGDPSYTPLEDKDCGGIYSAEISTTDTSLLFIKASTYKENFDNITAQTIDLTYPSDDRVLYDLSKLYLTPNSNWNVDNARFAAYFFGNGETWVSMNKVEGETNLYEVAIPTDKVYPNVIFCRMNPSAAANNWDNRLNQTNDLTLTTDGKRHNHYTVEDGAWSKGNGTWDGYWTTYTPNHTVSFNANGHGTAPEDQCITDGGKATNPGNLSATGYTFGGWYKEAGCTNAWDFANDVVTEDITLYAKWTANIHTLTWNVNGGDALTGTYTSGSVAYGTVIIKPADPTRTDYTFLGWKETDGSTTVAETMPDKDLTYTAQWKFIPTLQWSAPTCTVTIASESNVFPTLTATPDAIKSGVKFESSEPTVATINANGDIILQSEGKTTIKAYYEEDATYAATEATYELTVVESTNCWWEEVTIDDIEYGDEVVVVMVHGETLYALPYDSETASNSNPEATTITTDYFAGTVDETLIWYIMKGDGYTFTLSPKTAINKYLTCNSSNNAVRIDTDSERYFTIENGFLKNTTYSTYLAISTTATPPDWRHFTSTNTTIANKYQTLKFYKRVCLPEGQYWVKWMVNGQEYTEGNPTTMVTDGQITAIPDKPADDAIGDCADTFMGWSESNLGSAEGQPAPTDLFTTLAEAQSKIGGITENKTFYAVFATKEGSATDFKRVTSLDELSDGTSIVIASTKSSKFMTYSTAFGSSTWSESNGKITATDNMIFTLVANGDTWKIQKGTNVVSYEGRATSSPYCKPLLMNSNIKDWILVKNTSTTNTFTFYYEDGDYDYSIEYYPTESNWYAYSNQAPTSNDYYALALYVPDVTYSNYVTQCCTDWTPTLTYSKTTLDSESNETATPTITGNTHSAPVSFESSNESVLTVDANNGTITAVGAGKATITATWAKTGDYCEKSITTDEITVNGNFLVTFHANDGSGNTTTQQIPSNTATALKANTFQRDGYTFQGWATSASGAKVYDDGQKVTLSTSGLDLYAVWQVKAYEITIGTVTGNGTITTSPANSANCDAQVTITATPAAHYTLASVTVTRDDNSQTVDVVGNKFTMPASDVTITAVFTENEKFAINYDIPTGGGTLTDNAPTSIYIDGSITLPGIKDGTISSEYSCEQFIGWTTNPADYEAAGLKPEPFYKDSASFSGVSEDVTFYPVYSRPGAGVGGTVTLTEEEMYDWEDASYGIQRDLTTCVGTWTTTGYKSGSHAIQLKSDGSSYVKFPDLSGNITQVVLNATNGGDATLTSGTFTLKTEGGTTIASDSVNSSGICTIPVTGSYTTAYLYSSTTARITNIAITYGPPAIISTTLDCSSDVDECTITYDSNESFLISGASVYGSCTNSTFRFSEIGEYTICSNIRANQYVLVGWNNQCDGKGSLTYTPGQVITSLPQNNLTLYAQWAPVVSLNDAGSVSEVNATTFGGAVALPDGEKGCDPYEFVGWTTVYPSWNEESILPTIVDNPYTPTEPTTLYAVYAQRATSPDFTVNCDGGVYKIWVNNSAQNYMAGRLSTYYFYTVEWWHDGCDECEGSDGTPFTINKVGENTYTIQNADGEYIAKSSIDDEDLCVEKEWEDTDRYKWTISEGTNGSWRFTNKAATSYAIAFYNNYFRLSGVTKISKGSSYYDLELTPVESAVYYSAPSCGPYSIHFYTHGGEFVQGEYAFSTAVTEGLTDPTETKFPSAELTGYTFVGWKENSPQDELTDNAPEGDTSAEPYGLKKPGDDLITTTRREYHAVYYYYDELQDIDFSAPFTTGMYAEDSNGDKHFVTGTPHDRYGGLATTTACGDISEVTITPGTGANAGKFTISINGYSIVPANTVDLIQGNCWWTIEETSEGSGEYKIAQDTEDDRRNIVLRNSTFNYYKETGSAPDFGYGDDVFYPKFGNCREHHWASEPQRKPSIVLGTSGSMTITSSVGQTVKAANKLFVGATNYEVQTKIYLSCNVEGVELLYEDGGALSSDAIGKYLTTTAEGELATTYLILTYTPTATTDGIETVTITAQDEEGTAKATRLAQVRHLPENFVIAAKVGNMWYALPSQGLNSTDALIGYPVEVDNQNDPTVVTAVPENADWSLRQVYASSGSNDRFKLNGANIMFENNASPAEMLNASVSYNYLLTDAEYSNYYKTNPGLYEWTPTTTDLETYTLTNAQRTDRTLNVSVNTVFGVHAQNVATNSLRFLPIDDRYTPLALQVVEWKENSIVVMYNGDPAQTASVSVNGGAAQTTTLSAAQRDIAVYELTATGLAANPTQRLSITIGTEKLLLPIPYIVNSNTTDATLTSNNKTLAAVSDLVVLNGKTLTADAATASKYTFRNVTIYGGGSLIIPSGKGLGVNSLTMRVGAVVDNNYQSLYPSMLLAGTINTGNINIDYLTTADYYYPLSVPEEVTIGDIKYPVDIYGSNVDKANTGSFRLKYYDGAQRVKQGSQYGTGWVVVNEDETTTLTPNQGYAIWGIPKKINGTRQTYGIHRIPIKKAAADLIANETNDENIAIIAHGDASTPPNDRGWNYLGNPYLAQLGGMDGEDPDLQIGKLEQEKDANGDWTGGWVYNNEQVRYITVTNDCQNFDPRPVADATIPAFSTFFIQASQDGAILLTAPANPEPASIAARHYAAQQQAAKEITTGIILTGNDQTDRTGLLIADNFTEEYDFNADLSKFENSGINLYTIGKDGKLAYMAINQALAEQPIPLGYGAPADGEYTIAFDEDRYNATDISALYLIDYDRNEKTNLLHTDYSFVTTAGTNNERFALQVAFIPQNATSVEWVEDATLQVAVDGNNLLLNNLPTDAGVQVFDALGRVIYATPNAPTEMQITLPTGYYLVRIADKQHAVVINTVIP